MPEGQQVFTLLQVTKSIQRTISKRYKRAYWIKAEMNKLNHYSHSGHCYPDIVEKVNGKVVAQMRCLLWKDNFLKINNKFKSILKEPLKDGIKILFLAHINFHPQYGFSLQILDIDPSFSLGDLEQEKQKTIQKLQQEGIYQKNKSLNLPLLPKRIAIISVETSNGYADFLRVIESYHIDKNYRFFHLLFPSLLQGDKAIQAIISQLERIKTVKQHFDVVAIIRGGGGDVGLSCYNNYNLAKTIAEFPLPVLSGIGHSTNETVTEMVSFENAITPTKLAEFLIQKFNNFAEPVQKAQEKISEKSLSLLQQEQSEFSRLLKSLQTCTRRSLVQNQNLVNLFAKNLMQHSKFRISNEKKSLKYTGENIKKNSYLFYNAARQDIKQLSLFLKKESKAQLKQTEMVLNNVDQNLNNLSPENILKRGFSITQYKGKSVQSSKTLKSGDVLETVLYKGRLTSVVQKTEKPDDHE